MIFVIRAILPPVPKSRWQLDQGRLLQDIAPLDFHIEGSEYFERVPLETRRLVTFLDVSLVL